MRRAACCRGPTKTSFLGVENVKRVVLVRRLNAQVVGSVPAVAGQTDYRIPFTAPDAGDASEFFAFVETTWLPTDQLLLELGQAIGTLPAHVSVSAGDSTCGVTSGGTVKCWGAIDVGQGLNSANLLPVEVPALGSGMVAVDTLGARACAINTAGALQCWGPNGGGQLGNGSLLSSSGPVPVLGLGSGAIAVSVGADHSCAIVTGGAVKCWGENDFGQLGRGDHVPSLVPVSVSGLTGAVAISAGFSRTCVLTSAGGVTCWGRNAGEVINFFRFNSSIPVSVVGLESGVTAISVGESHACAVTATGGAKCWGANSYGQLGLGSHGTGDFDPTDVVGLSGGVKAISAGTTHTCALMTAGLVKCWGSSEAGALGQGSTTLSVLPANVAGLSGITAIETGSDVTCAVTSSSRLKCWGQGARGALGNGGDAKSGVPLDVVNF